ncbi:MAG TPA: hypothetical protein VFR24_13640 [Candidatus Angelobacter sp.]|nr:hypothetical protein [Candidatus Angelobacter sp.]
MKHGRRFFLLLALFASIAGPQLSLCTPQQQPPDQQIGELVRSSPIIFIGRALKLKAVNLKVLKANDSTVIVRVEELLDAPPSLIGLKGQDVTLQTQRPGSLREGQKAVFFTTGILFGEHLEVKENGELPAPADTASLRKQIAAARGQAENEKLQARVQSAVLIVSGTVMEVKPLGQPQRSEHDPDWAEAVIEITSVQKGEQPGRTVTILFPQSTDERWYLAPKFRRGQSGIWLLHREPKGLPEDRLTALSPLDFHPLEREPAIRGLIHSSSIR